MVCIKKRKKRVIFLTIILSLAIAGFGGTQAEIIELSFKQPPVSDSDISRTLKSLVKVRDISETYSTGGLYLMTHVGDYEDIFQKENQKAIENPMINQSWRYCSVFSTTTDHGVIMGRNWDNQNVGSIIVSLYHPPGGYASTSFSRAIDMGFPLNVDLMAFKSSKLGRKLLLAPFYAMDGINEHGLAVAVTGVKQTTHKPKGDKELVLVTFLVRKILDQTKTIEEAVNLVEKLKEKCWRYRSISETLEKNKGNIDWKAGMKILRDVTQKGTTWSVVYSPPTKELYVSVYQKWNRIYHMKSF